MFVSASLFSGHRLALSAANPAAVIRLDDLAVTAH